MRNYNKRKKKKNNKEKKQKLIVKKEAKCVFNKIRLCKNQELQSELNIKYYFIMLRRKKTDYEANTISRAREYSSCVQ